MIFRLCRVHQVRQTQSDCLLLVRAAGAPAEATPVSFGDIHRFGP